MFCSTGKGSLSNVFPILYSEGFTLFKKAAYHGLSSELNTPFDLQLRTWSVPLPYLNSNVSSVGW